MNPSKVRGWDKDLVLFGQSTRSMENPFFSFPFTW